MVLVGVYDTLMEAIGAAPAGEVAALRRDVAVAEANNELLEQRLQEATPLDESVIELERALTRDPQWRRFVIETQQEFTPEGRRQMRAVCRLSSIGNPLLKRGLGLRSAYVWGSGVEITARANGQNTDGEQDIQSVINNFLNDDANLRAVTGPEACNRLEHALGFDGEVFIAHFTKPLSGSVQTRVLLADEIAEIICNPEDRSEPWYYRRRWTEKGFTPDGTPTETPRERLYPDLDYRPKVRLKKLGTIDIAWDAPVLHVAVNRPEGWQHGIPDVYAAVNWARAYKEFLEQWATLMKSLSRFAWRLTSKGQQRSQARAALAAAPPVDLSGRAQDVGATAITPLDGMLEAIPKSGATFDADSGRPLAAMVAAALDVPVTMLLADPGQTGARAVAETLDQPTELVMGQRRELWSGVRRRQARYVIMAAVRAPRGPLKGVVRWDADRDRETVELAGKTDPTIDVMWPAFSAADVGVVVEAIVKAASTGTVPPEEVLRLLLTALGVRDVDALVSVMVDDQGEFQWPDGPPLSGGQQMALAGKLGADPAAAADGGSMQPEGPPANSQADLPAGPKPPPGG